MLFLHFIISITLNVVISILAFIPSIFLTAWNVSIFGLAGGMIVGFLGEAIGAAVAFTLYRKGFQPFVSKRQKRFHLLDRLLAVTGKEACILIFSLRLLPYIPSSAVTLFAALGKVSFSKFFISSTIGKMPALIVETLSMHYAFLHAEKLTILFVIIGFILLVIAIRNIKKAIN